MCNNYDYHMYVDASGDDGVKFDLGSSKCYVACSIITHKDDINHNLELLSQIKKMMGAKEKDEVKHSKIRRHPNSAKIYKLIPEFKASAYSAIIFKQLTKKPEFLNPSSKLLSSVSHVISMASLEKHFAKLPTSGVKIIIDRMKTSEESAVSSLMKKLDVITSSDTLPEHSIMYKDSKAKGYELIQLADIVAGLTRTYFENHNNDKILLKYWNVCPLCTRPYHRLCKRKRLPPPHEHFFFYSLPLYRANHEKHCIHSISYEPVNLQNRFKYLFCHKKK